MKFLFAFLLGFLSLGAAELKLAENGKTEYVIVTPDSMDDGEKFILRDFQTLLKQAFQTDFPVVAASKMPKEKRIFLGLTPLAIQILGSDPLPGMVDQDHCVKTVGNDLFLFGKGPNGNRYAVYDFLENVLGYRFYDARGGMKVPDCRNLTLPALDRKKQFDFPVRRTTMYWLFNHPHSTYFLYRNGQNNWVAPVFKGSGIVSTPDDFLHLYPLGHTLSWYLPKDGESTGFKWIHDLRQNLWKEHPEYFTMNKDGKRVSDHQYCMSNPELRKLLSERILENMKRNPQCASFDVSANDTPGRFCYCPKCLELEKKYGTVGGPLFDFFLEFCPVAAKKYPGKWITTLIYRKDQTQHPPKNIQQFPDNFAPVFAPIDDNFAKDWSHSDNRETYEDLKTWGRLCKHLLVWYYPNPYSGNITPPFGNVERLANDIRLMKEAGVTGMVWEHNVGVPEMIGFTELQSYVALQLFQDVNRQWKELADDFMNFEYGKAAPLMKQYWLELEELRKNEPLQFVWNPTFSAYTYLTPERLVRWNGLFDKMEDILKDDPAKRFNVQRVRVNLDLSILQSYAKVKKVVPDFNLSPEQLADRLRGNYSQAIKRFFGPSFSSRAKDYQKGLEDMLLILQIQSGKDAKPLPKEIFGMIPADRIFVSIPKVNGNSYQKDPDAAFGWRAVFSKPEPKLPFKADFEDLYGKKYQAGIGAVTQKTLGPRGKYEFYRIAKIKLSPDCLFRMGVSDWWDFKTSIGGAYVMGAFNHAEVYASLKFEGPAFYKEDAGKKNTVYCDRVVVVRLD